MAIEFRLPELGENVQKAEVVSLLVTPGQRVEQDQGLIEIETDKAAMELPSPVAGVIKEIHVAPGDAISVGDLLVTLEPAEATTEASSPPEERAPSPPPAKEPPPEAEPPHPAREESDTAPAERIPVGPATRRLARELGVDLSRVKGTGPRGRITQDDVKRFVREQVAQPAENVHDLVRVPSLGTLPDFTRWGEIAREPLRSVRKKTAAHMSLAWSQVPHVTHHDEADVTDLEAIRQVFRHQAETAGGKLTILSFIVKACALALGEFPIFNSTLDLANEEIILKKYINIGIAVETERGLLVPVLKEADKLGIIEIAVALTQLAERARQNKLTLDEMQGGTFTITNLGGIGGTGFTPIVNFPEVAILGVSRTRKVFIPAEGHALGNGASVRMMMPLSLSYDHRVIDGAAAARFVRFIVEYLENPGRLVQLS